MSKKRIFALITLLLCGILIITNPPAEQHQIAVREKAKEILLQQLEYENQDAVDLGMTLFGNQLINQFMENMVHTDNYYFFSLTTISWQGKESIIGIGAFNKVWLTKKIDDKVEEVITTLKKI